jgi:hypothetical protein
MLMCDSEKAVPETLGVVNTPEIEVDSADLEVQFSSFDPHSWKGYYAWRRPVCTEKEP